MTVKTFPFLGKKFTVLVFAISMVASVAMAKAPFEREIGDKAPIFSLATTHDRLMNYDQDYYGKHHLVLTFFPAAFTPV